MRMHGMHECNMHWQMDGFPIGLPKLASLSTHGFEIWVTIINQYKDWDDTDRHL
jgi:hypothetical protein